MFQYIPHCVCVCTRVCVEYADDMVLVSGSWENLCAMVHCLEKICTDMGLCISIKKTKIMAVPRCLLVSPVPPKSSVP